MQSKRRWHSPSIYPIKQNLSYSALLEVHKERFDFQQKWRRVSTFFCSLSFSLLPRISLLLPAIPYTTNSCISPTVNPNTFFIQHKDVPTTKVVSKQFSCICISESIPFRLSNYLYFGRIFMIEFWQVYIRLNVNMSMSTRIVPQVKIQSPLAKQTSELTQCSDRAIHVDFNSSVAERTLFPVIFFSQCTWYFTLGTRLWAMKSTRGEEYVEHNLEACIGRNNEMRFRFCYVNME